MSQNTSAPLAWVQNLTLDAIPPAVQQQVKLSLLDTLGIALGGLSMRASQLSRDFAATAMPGALPMLFDGRPVSLPGWALAAGMTIDALDGHDGFNPAKGHIAAPMMPVALAFAHAHEADGAALLRALVAGYEFGARAAMAQHGTTPDYHTSGSWGAVTGALVGAELAGLPPATTRHALGIAEYHGPRSQMMRCIDHPTMVKDGAGWGAMCGASAVMLAEAGFTGAPALTVEEAPAYWADLGQRWYALEQYYKPYPVCRWAQAPVEAVLHLRRTHGLTADQVQRIEVTTFHESLRLATDAPTSTEAAQYSTSFPCAVALVHGDVRPEHLVGDALHDPEVLRLSRALIMQESDAANAAFPLRRFATVEVMLLDGTRLRSPRMEPRWDHTAPPTTAELHAKFHALADPVLGQRSATELAQIIDTLEHGPLERLWQILLCAP
ncbi:MmgE/PrpD family protein [Epibacterium sp. MM17-32]|uniref:MmgE/PrpD family protein n=1 Tax=Epibacterium sp. MM17-32 TaxID=2917734 RepID=UPI001EF65CA8|nr:MmgE/PrpD family protein [Epibacterium sp. MM17-32]MCG7629501.1 MmgE/PrpD family protein [Epibacterium sp. MM17-32]